MKYKASILILFLYSYLALSGQRKTPVQVFHNYTQICSFTAAINTDYILELFEDSTIRIYKYITGSRDFMSSLTRETYFGTYIFKKDTIQVKYLSHAIETKYKNSSYLPGSKISNFVNTIFPATVFLINDTAITPLDHFLPFMQKILPLKAQSLNAVFEYWNKQGPLITKKRHL